MIEKPTVPIRMKPVSRRAMRSTRLKDGTAWNAGCVEFQGRTRILNYKNSGCDPGIQLVALDQILRPDRQLPNAFACGAEDCIGHCGSNCRRAGFADPARWIRAGYDVG